MSQKNAMTGMACDATIAPMREATVIRWRHREAPAKPEPGAPCNGCGVCCLLEACPLGILLSRRQRGACVALRWNAAQRRYVCGVLSDPAAAFGWGNGRFGRVLSRLAVPLVRRWIAAGQGCDCTAQLDFLVAGSCPDKKSPHLPSPPQDEVPDRY